MTQRIWDEAKKTRVAGALSWYGRLGFWVQFIFLIVVLLLGILTFTAGSGAARATLANVLSFLLLIIPAFTTFWCLHYARLGAAFSGGSDIAPATLFSKLWIGVWASFAGALASLLSLFGAASALVVTLLTNPQVGLQIAPVTGEGAIYSISAADSVSILSLVLTLTAELIVIFLSLRLYFLVRDASHA